MKPSTDRRSIPSLLLGVALVAAVAAAPTCTRRDKDVRDPTSDPVAHPDKKSVKQNLNNSKTNKTKPDPKLERKTPPKDPLRAARLARFASADEFDGYLDKVRAEWKRMMERQRAHARRSRSTAGAPPAKPATSAAQPQAESAPADATASADDKDESITNNQENGVDEGDIVKAAGDYFVILRRGRLFSVRQRDAGQPTLTPAGRCNAYPPGGSQGTWYDEMLLHRDRIIVIGYSYRVGGTEIGLFRLGEDGSITHEATHFLRSNDYYSSRNYASRLVGNKLIFYMPYFLRYQGQTHVDLPAVTSWRADKRRAAPWREILSKVDVYRPVQRTLTPTLHTVVQCNLGRNRFNCSARSVVGPYSRTFYVSRDAVYVWVGPGYGYHWGQPKQELDQRDRAYVYRMPILGGGVTAIRARGNPIDQFSFKQGADGYLNVLLTASGGGDWMFNAEHGGRGAMALLRVPVAVFSDMPMPAARWRYTALPKPTKGYALQNRFVGNWVLWGSGAGWWNRADNGGQLFATHVKRPAEVNKISLDHGVDRIEAMGQNAVVVGSGKSDLFFTSVELADQPTVRNTWVRANAAQGETRSHGFFFLPDSDGGGMLGLPVRTQGRPGHHLVHGSAEVQFLRVEPSLRFVPLGALAARDTSVNDHCVVSCVDWYGNARPIFFRGRVFALLGYELVEGALDGNKLHERNRTHFLTPRLALR
jgi:hypothetical protein